MRQLPVLEGYLSFWEDTMFVLNILAKLKGLTSPPVLAMAGDFRRELLKGKEDELLDGFMFPSSGLDWSDNNVFLPFGQNQDSVALEVHDWNISSRRSFRISGEMQHSFEHISVADIPMHDVLWPFRSFLVELETPIERQTNNAGALLVSRPFRYSRAFNDPDDSVVMVSLLSEQLQLYKPIPPEEKRRALRSITHGNSQRANKFMGIYGSKLFRSSWRYGHSSVLIGTKKEMSVREYFEQGVLNPEGQKAVRILLNLCMYLEAHECRATQPQWSKNPRQAGLARNIITDQMQVCDISGMHTLYSLTETDGSPGFRGECTEPHWRRAHKRRRPGEGHLPEAPRVVGVKTALVRPDLIPPYGLVGGSITKI